MYAFLFPLYIHFLYAIALVTQIKSYLFCKELCLFFFVYTFLVIFSCILSLFPVYFYSFFIYFDFSSLSFHVLCLVWLFSPLFTIKLPAIPIVLRGEILFDFYENYCLYFTLIYITQLLLLGALRQILRRPM